MLGHYDAGFTLRTYTHATRQKQEQAAEKMGNFMNKVMWVWVSKKNGWNFLPGSTQLFPFISSCGSRCGSRRKTVNPSRTSTKSKPEIYPQYPFYMQNQGKVSSQDNLCKHNKSPAYFMQDFVNGGGEWIRTTEVVDNRFTVCPLWPLGNSPIKY